MKNGEGGANYKMGGDKYEVGRSGQVDRQFDFSNTLESE